MNNFQEVCPYCGSELKKPTDGEKPGQEKTPKDTALSPIKDAISNTFHPSADNKNYGKLSEKYVCSGCQILTCRAELDKEAERLGWQELQSSSESAAPAPGEEETLRSAWELMLQQQWEQASEELFQRGFPWQHPADFLIYRNICQTAPFYSLYVKDHQPAYAGLDILAHNLKHIEYYEPQDKEQRRQMLRRIYEAMLLLVKLPLKCSTDKQSSYKDIMHLKRVECLDIYAYYLENLDSPNPEAENLRMAEQLWRTCLKNIKLSISSGSALLNMDKPESEIELNNTKESAVITIEDNIKRVTSALKALDPGYKPQALPNIYAPHKFHKTAFAYIAGAVLVWTGLCETLDDSGLEISFPTMMYVYIFIITAGLIAWIILYLYKFRPWEKKREE